MVPCGNKQPDPHHQGASELCQQTDHCHSVQDLGAAKVQDGSERYDHETTQDRGVHAAFHADQGAQEGPCAIRDAGDSGQERHQVNPAVHPTPFAAPEPPGPGIDSASHWICRHHFTENRCNQELPDPHDDQGPKHRWAGHAQGCREQGIDRYYRRQVGESQRDVPPERHLPLELPLVRITKAGKMLSVVIDVKLPNRFGGFYTHWTPSFGHYRYL
jgi:hypothetical protein